MNCKDVQYRLVDYIDNNLEAGATREVKQHVAGCSSCLKELEELILLIRDMNQVKQEVPGPELRAGFLGMLEKEKEEQGRQARIISLLGRRNAFAFSRVAAAVLLVLAGTMIGWLFRGPAGSSQEIASLKGEIEQMRTVMMLSQLADGSASQRIQVAHTISTVQEPSDEMVNALILTMNNDDNVNVRLAAINALTAYVGRQEVRERLIHSLNKQDDPFVQITLINLLISMQDKNAIPELEKARNNPESLDLVRQKAGEGIEVLM